MRWFIPAAMLLSPAPAFAAAPPEALADSFIAAWNSHAPKAFDVLFTDDAVWVPVAEERTEGRAAIVNEFAKIHTGHGWAIKTTIARNDTPEAHLIKPDVATVFFHMVSSGTASRSRGSSAR